MQIMYALYPRLNCLLVIRSLTTSIVDTAMLPSAIPYRQEYATRPTKEVRIGTNVVTTPIMMAAHLLRESLLHFGSDASLPKPTLPTACAKDMMPGRNTAIEYDMPASIARRTYDRQNIYFVFNMMLFTIKAVYKKTFFERKEEHATNIVCEGNFRAI